MDRIGGRFNRIGFGEGLPVAGWTGIRMEGGRWGIAGRMLAVPGVLILRYIVDLL
jgi:hypothetical protein